MLPFHHHLRGLLLRLLIVTISLSGSSIALAQDTTSLRPNPMTPVRISPSLDAAHGKAIETIDMQRGKATLLHTTFDVSRLAIGDPEVADFLAISKREIEILAKDIGDTNLLVWGGGRLQAVIDLHVAGLQPQVTRELSRLLANPDIRVDVAGGSIILRGNVPNLLAFQHAEALATAFLAKGEDVLAGQDVSAPPQVINLLEVGGGHQVMIDVIIAELRRSVSRAMGVNIIGAFNTGSGTATFQTMLKNLAQPQNFMGGAISPTSAGAISESVTLAGSYFSANQMNVQMFVEAVEANQLGTILAKPTVVARSGEAADFLVGGEVPIPLVNNLNATNTQFTIIFKKFGVNVEFTPTVLADDRIHLLITPEVSEPDFSFGVRVLGSTVPAFQTRRVNTSVELGDGESFVLGGLIREDILADYENFPFLADVPILGQFFRTRTFQKRQTELVMIVTPHLVKPVEPGVEFELPTDHYIEPSLVEFYWDGRIEGRAPKEEDEGSESAAAGEARRDPNLLPEEALEVAARQQESTGFGGFIGPFGHRLKTPQPVGDVQ